MGRSPANILLGSSFEYVAKLRRGKDGDVQWIFRGGKTQASSSRFVSSGSLLGLQPDSSHQPFSNIKSIRDRWKAVVQATAV